MLREKKREKRKNGLRKNNVPKFGTQKKEIIKLRNKSRRVGLKKYLRKGILILGDVLYFSFQIFLIIVFLVLTIHCLKMGMLAATAMCAIAAVIVGVWSVKNINSKPSKLIEEWKADKK